MKEIINRVAYDSDRCETLAERNDYHNGNYTGCRVLMLASDGKVLCMQTTNGQDLYRDNRMWIPDELELGELLGKMIASEGQIKRLQELNIIKIA